MEVFFDIELCTLEFVDSEEYSLVYHSVDFEQLENSINCERKTFIYSFRLKGFKAEQNNFSMECNVFVSFDKFKCRVAYILNGLDLLRKKTYDLYEYLSEMPEELGIKYGDNFSEQDLKEFEKQALSECISLIKDAEKSETEPVYVNEMKFIFEAMEVANENKYIKNISYQTELQSPEVMLITFYADVPKIHIERILDNIVKEVDFLKIPIRQPQIVYQVLSDERSDTLKDEFDLDDDELPSF